MGDEPRDIVARRQVQSGYWVDERGRVWPDAALRWLATLSGQELTYTCEREPR